MAEIRFLKVEEAPLVLDLWNSMGMEASKRDLDAEERAHVLAALQQYPAHSDTLCLVAVDGNTPVGFVTACLTHHPILSGTAGEIEELYVAPSSRRDGLGSRLVEEAVRLLRTSGAATIRTHCCIEAAENRTLLQRLGWENDLAAYSLYR